MFHISTKVKYTIIATISVKQEINQIITDKLSALPAAIIK